MSVFFSLFLEKDRILPGTRCFRSPGGRKVRLFCSNPNHDSGCRLGEVGREARMIVEAVLQIGDISAQVVVQDWMLRRDGDRRVRSSVADSGERG